MLETVQSAALVGIRVQRVRVEVAISRGTPSIQVVGLAASAVRDGSRFGPPRADFTLAGPRHRQVQPTN